MTRVFLILLTVFSELAFSEPATLKPIFSKQEISLAGRLRHLTLEDVIEGGGKEIVILERSGDFPAWRNHLTIFGWRAPDRKIVQLNRTPIPADTLFYGFAGHDLVLIRSNRVEKWKLNGDRYELDPLFHYSFTTPFTVEPSGDVSHFDPEVDGSFIAVPADRKIILLENSSKGFRLKSEIQAPVRAYYSSAVEVLPLDLSFWVRGTLWYPSWKKGKLKSEEESWIFPWMDEVTVLSPDHPNEKTMLNFNLLTERERDDNKSYVATFIEDLNGDGRVDFLANKTQGSATSLQADTTIYISRPDGSLGVPQKIKPIANRTGGAVPVDFNRDGLKDLVVASTQYNAWAIIRALLGGRVNVSFSFYMNRPEGFRLDAFDFSKEVSFDFDLEEGMVKGLLPTVDGDFNGDGYPDVFYAGTPRAVTVIFQEPKEKEFFLVSKGRTFEVPVLRQDAIGDVDGDGKSDAILFDRRSSKNKTFIYLRSEASFDKRGLP